MASPMRLDSLLVAAAEREGALQKRSTPKQIEFWAELGKAVENFIGLEDIIAVNQGLKKIEVELVESKPVDPDDIFDTLEKSRRNGALSEKVTSSTIYFEASLTKPGLLDRVQPATGKRESGSFVKGEFKAAK